MTKYRICRRLYRIWDARVKIFSMFLIIILAFFDYAAMRNLFIDLNVSDAPLLPGGELDPRTFLPLNFRGYISEVYVYPMMMVILLEGIPYFLGREISVLLDRTTYRSDSKNYAGVAFGAACIGLMGTFILVGVMRIMVINLMGGFPVSGNTNAEWSEDLIVQVGLLISPILTSILAFVASLVSFKSESAEELEKKIDRLHIKFLNEQSRFYDLLNRNEDAKTALWSSLNSNQNGAIPTEFDNFRKACFDRIRAKLIENVIIQYPGQISRFNAEVEGMFETFIRQMSGMETTNDAYEIRAITPEQLFKEYDQFQVQEETPMNAWNYAVAGEELENEMKKVLDNAVVVAQFKTADKPYHMEGEF